MADSPCEFLEWDSAFWGFAVARVRKDALAPGELAEVDAWCRRERIRCLYFLARADDPAATRLAELAGFHLADVRVTLRHEAAGTPETGSAAVRECRPEDVPVLRRIARESHRDSRFYADPHFPRRRCDDLYEVWIAKSCEGYAQAVLVAESGGEPAGYLSCHLDGSPAGGRIGLVGVSAHARGAGVGRTLVLSALDWFRNREAESVSVVTQGRNCAAQRVYQRCGFVTQSVQLWYHRWYPEGHGGR